MMEHLYEVDQLKQQLDNLYDIAFNQHQDREKIDEVYARIKKLNLWMKTYLMANIPARAKLVQQWQGMLQDCIDQIEAE